MNTFGIPQEGIDRLNSLLGKAEAMAAVLAAAALSDDKASDDHIHWVCFALEGMLTEAREISESAKVVRP